MRERDIEAYLVKSVKALGGEVRKVQWIGRRGAPDRLVMLPVIGERVGRAAYEFRADDEKEAVDNVLRGLHSFMIWVELKAPGKKAELHQLREHKRMEKMGQRVVVIDSLEGVDELLAGGFR
jgi:hypothetical protein